MVVDHGQSFEGLGHLERIRPERLLADRQGSLQERDRLVRIAPIAKDVRRVSKDLREGGILGRETLLRDLHCSPGQRHGFGELALLVGDFGQIHQTLTVIGIVRPEDFLGRHKDRLKRGSASSHRSSPNKKRPDC